MEWNQLRAQNALLERRQQLVGAFKAAITKVKKSLSALGCCELCGLDMPVDLASSFNQQLICPHCIEALPLFNQDLVYSDLLTWPAINKALPKIEFDHLFSLAPYIHPFDRLIPQFKYHGRFELGHTFASILANEWQLSAYLKSPNAIVAVPLHIKKWQKRGYNQAHLLAKHFAQSIEVPYFACAITRVKNTESQMGKVGAARRQNLKSAFTLNQKFHGIDHVLLIDDVVTTGTTASEISKLLKSSGVKTVTLVTVCLSLPKG